MNKLLPIPGVAEHAHGFRDIAEALYFRDHVIRQIELADDTDDPAEREARLTFVVVGAGYTGTEVAAQGVLLTDALFRTHPRLNEHAARWLLVDIADRADPGSMSDCREPLLGCWAGGVEVRLGTSVREATGTSVVLSDGDRVTTRSLFWCVGVRPEPLVAGLGLKTTQGRLVVDEFLSVPGYPEVYSCGDVAAVPDLTEPGQITAMTAQHAQRQGVSRPQHCRVVRARRATAVPSSRPASWWTSAERGQRPILFWCRCPACPPSPSPAAITCWPCRAIEHER